MSMTNRTSTSAPLCGLLRRHPTLCVMFAMLLAAGCGSSAVVTQPSPTAEEPLPAVRRIVVLGDSLAVSPSPEQSFPAHLQARLARDGRRYTVTNAGVSGETTEGGVRRVESLLMSDVAVLIVELGANDGLLGTPVVRIETNLSTIIRAAQGRGVLVLLCGMEVPPRHGLDYSVAFHFIFPRLARQHGVPLVPFLLEGVALNTDLNAPDGVHPNAIGAERIAATVWPYLAPLLR
jgi:acyl-CoA thioesterase-1